MTEPLIQKVVVKKLTGKWLTCIGSPLKTGVKTEVVSCWKRR